MNSKFYGKLSVTAKNILFNIVLGITLLGSTMMFEASTKPIKVIGSLSMMLAGLLIIFDTIWTYSFNEEKDEMFKNHMLSAKAKTLEIITGGLLVYGVFSCFVSTNHIHDWRVLAFIAVGLSRILTGIYFIYLEKKGELY